MKKLLIAALTLLASSTLCAEDNWYSIEMIVFAHIDEESAHEEQWPDDVIMSYPRQIRRLLNAVTLHDDVDITRDNAQPLDLSSFDTPLNSTPSDGLLNFDASGLPLVTETTTPAQASPTRPIPVNFQRLDISYQQLNSAMAHLRRIDRYKPLFHETWMQNLTDRKRSPGILITGGGTFGKHRELEGYVKLSVERYLHIETDLWLHEFEANFGQTKLMQAPEIPLQGNNERESLSFSSQFDELLKNPYQIKRTVTLRQSRRMRSNEIHYLDHPLMGVIVVVKPLVLKPLATTP